MPNRRIIWALTLIVLGLVLVIPLIYGSLIFGFFTGPAALLLTVGFFVALCLLALLLAIKRPR